MDPGSIVVVTGPPGAGKSTVAARVAATFDPSVHLRGDEFFDFLARGFVFPWLPESQHQNEVVQSAITAAALRYALGGYTVVLDWVLGPWALEQLADETGNTGAEVHYVVLRPDEATCVARAVARPAPELTDPEPVRQMHAAFRALAGYERHVVDSTDLSPEQTAEAVLAAVSAGTHTLVEIVGGPEQRELVIADPEPAWADRFASEAATIAGALGDLEHRIEHIGSTSVPGLPAKPIVDIQVSVPDVHDEAAWLPALEAAGYVLRVREPGHRLVRTPERDVHVHVCSAGSAWERRHLAFRDHLRRTPGDRDLYAAVKRRLATRTWPTVQHYANAKSAVVAEITSRIDG